MEVLFVEANFTLSFKCVYQITILLILLEEIINIYVINFAFFELFGEQTFFLNRD